MKIKYIISVLFTIGLVFGCQENKVESSDEILPDGVHKVEVLEFTDVPQYTYLRVNEDGKEYWIAAPTLQVKNGDILYYSQGMEMREFYSESLDKTFESIIFVQRISSAVPQEKMVMQSPHTKPSTSEHQKPGANFDSSINIEHGAGFTTISEVYNNKANLSEKSIKVRGKVTKFNPNIMDRNWIHLQDGTKSGNDFDLVITIKENVKVGDIVSLEGNLGTNIDFKFSIIRRQ